MKLATTSFASTAHLGIIARVASYGLVFGLGLTLTACSASDAAADAAAERGAAPEGAVSDVESAATTNANATRVEYLRVVPGDTEGTYVVSRVNGGGLACPAGPSGLTCEVTELVLPEDCGWECRDGLLSFRGVTVFRGRLVASVDPATRARTARLEAYAGFDTYDSTLGTRSVFRITGADDPRVATRVNNPDVRKVESVDFSAAHDPNYALDPARGFEQMALAEGLLVTGRAKGGVFEVDRVFRQWTPAPAPTGDVVVAE